MGILQSLCYPLENVLTSLSSARLKSTKLTTAAEECSYFIPVPPQTEFLVLSAIFPSKVVPVLFLI